MRVGASIGVTIQINPNNQYEFARPHVEILDIDPEQDVDAQLDKANAALVKILDAEEKRIYQELIEISDDPTLRSALDSRFRELDKQMAAIREALSDTVRKQV